MLMIFLVGTSTWTVYGDYLCTNDPFQDVMVNLNSATGMFDCMNGDGILMSKRCNGRCDCLDCSDEDSCKVLDTLVDYNPRILTVSSGGLAKVDISTVVTNMPDLDENMDTVTLNLIVSIQWYDFRLTFLNLSPNM
jgi:hypothetical protein